MRQQGRSSRSHRWWVAGVVACTLALLAGCSADDSDDLPVAQGVLVPDATVDATPEPTPTAAAEVADDVADGLDEQPTVIVAETPTPSDLPTGPPPTATPEAEVAPTPTPSVPTPTPGPTPTREPVPSDELQVDAPSGTADEPPSLSDGTALACASVEEAIEFLDFGDAVRVADSLADAAGHAASAVEPDMVAQAEVLAGFDGDLDTAFDIILSTLNICSRYGYEV